MKGFKQGGLKRGISLLLAVTCAVLLTACSGAGSSDAPGGGKWTDSDIIGFIKAEDMIRPQDDFASAVNQDWIINGYPNEEKGGAEYFIVQRYYDTLDDESITGANAEVMRTLRELVLDWDERERLGFEPLRKYLEPIENINSLADATAFQGSLEANPFSIGLLMPQNVDGQIQFPDKSALKLSIPTYSLRSKAAYLSFESGSLEAKQRNDEIVTTVLSGLGYSDKEIKRILKENYEFETQIAKIDNSKGSNDNIYSKSETFEHMYTDREGLSNYARAYPIFEILDGRGFSECDSLYLDYMYLAALPGLYNEKHLSEIKSYFTVQLINKTRFFFDRSTLDRFITIEGSKASKDPVELPGDWYLFEILISQAGYLPLMDTLYLDKYFPDDTKVDLYMEMVDELIESYHIMINEEDWMSDETKQTAIEKLENMAIHVIRPDNTADYSDVAIKSYAEGGNLLDAAAEGWKEDTRHTAENAADPAVDRYLWDIYETNSSTTQVNSFYMPSKNAIYILAGWIAAAEYTYGEDATYEQMLGYVGTVVGHEISHGFDSSGSKYDKLGRAYDEKGNEIDWMTNEDRTRLNERAGKLASYFSLCRPVPGKKQVLGKNIMDEAMADMAGIKAVLYMVRDKEDFDYDEFFRAYAALWRLQRKEEDEIAAITADEHPLNYYRININLQQFDEFLDTYDIKPGDGMYLAPEERISVW